EAFTRRLDVVVDFPLPDTDMRHALWDACHGTAVPRAADLDLGFLAAAFELAGGHIRSAAVTAAYLVAEAGRPVGTPDLIGAAACCRARRPRGVPTCSARPGCSACNARSATPASARCWRRTARPYTTWSTPAAASPWTARPVPTWNPAWATTSATCGCTPTA